MTAMSTIRGSAIFLAPILLLSCTLAQIAGDRLAPMMSALQNKEFEKALALLQPALEEYPANPQLWALQGTVYAGESRTKEALGSFHNALKISADYLPALEGAAQIEYEAGSPAAIPLIEHVTRLRPADRTSHAMLAVLEYQQGNCTAAIAHFEKAGPLLASQPSALHADAVCLVKLNQCDRAGTGLRARGSSECIRPAGAAYSGNDSTHGPPTRGWPTHPRTLWLLWGRCSRQTIRMPAP